MQPAKPKGGNPPAPPKEKAATPKAATPKEKAAALAQENPQETPATWLTPPGLPPPGVFAPPGPPPKAPAGVRVRHRWIQLDRVRPIKNDDQCECTGCVNCQKGDPTRQCNRGPLPGGHNEWDYDLAIAVVQEWDLNNPRARRSTCKRCRSYWWGYAEAKQAAEQREEFGEPDDPIVEPKAAPTLAITDGTTMALQARVEELETRLAQLQQVVHALRAEVERLGASQNNSTSSLSWGPPWPLGWNNSS